MLFLMGGSAVSQMTTPGTSRPAFAQTSQQGEVTFVPSPSNSLSGTLRFVEAVELRVLIALGYERRSDLSGKLSGQDGVQESRVYARSGVGPERRVGIAIVRGVRGGYELAVSNEQEITGAGPAGQNDTASISRRTQELAAEAAKGVEPDPAFEVVRLGHIEAGQALDLLKALGYETMSLEQVAQGSTPGRSTTSRTSVSSRAAGAVTASQDKLPIIISVGNATKTSVMEAASTGRATTSGTRPSTGSARGGLSGGSPQLGGTHLHSATAGAPEQRLLIMYDRNDPEPLERILNILQTQIDVAAKQIVIEALVVELNTSLLRDLGVEWSANQNDASASFERDSGTDLPFTFLFSRDGFEDFVDIKGKIEALAETGDAEVLSSPSVLVLNDRQARIQVGQQVPVVSSTTTVSTTRSSVEYFPVGIVLNLRPRISPDDAEVTMQIETIISSISETSPVDVGGSSQVAFAPVVDNRTVETYVRVADGTPFIIGGLLSTEKRDRRVGIPLIGRFPLVGRLFSRESTQQDSREVIVVITPHIVPLNDRSFSYLIPKDSDLFNRFDTQLFRNAYRVRDDDVWDLRFIRESPAGARLVDRVAKAVESDLTLRRKEPFSSILNGRVAGEDVLVRRMIYEIVDRLKFQDDIDPTQVFLFRPPPPGRRGQRFEDAELTSVIAGALKSPEQTTILGYGQKTANTDVSFELPLADVRDTSLTVADQETLLWDLNFGPENETLQGHSIVLSNGDDVRRLQQVLILKQVLELNQNLPLTLDAFRPGVQILFPTREDIRNRFHLIDQEVAQMFYETVFYYQASEHRFNQVVEEVDQLLGAEGGGQ
jgi:general secretion pathway protein D